MSSRLIGVVLFSVCAAVPAFYQDAETARTAGKAGRGQKLFEAQCARCHGLKGTGGTGPGLNRARLRRAADDLALYIVLRGGIPGTEMPPTWQMDDREIAEVSAYVRSLGRVEASPLPGDPAKGKALYAKSDCSKCHAVKGQGGTLGPDLTEVGARRGAAHLRQILLDPGSAKLVDGDGFITFLNIQVVTHDGRVVQGLRVSEDSFSITLRDAESRLHSFDKQELAETKREPQASVMPSYAKTFTAQEIDGLVSYLASLRGE
jgi:putative heme-binding domain-containing protein